MKVEKTPENAYIVWYLTDDGGEDFKTLEADDEYDARAKFHVYHDNIITEVHKIDWDHQVVAD